MKDCEAKAVNKDNDFDENNTDWKHLMRQIMVSSVVWMGFLVYGLGFGAPTVFIPQIRKENNSTDAIDESMQSWLACIFDYGAAPWSIIMPISACYLGRKPTYAFCCFVMLTSSIILYCSISAIQILISEALIAIVLASTASVSVMILGECISPKYRGIFLTIMTTTFFCGVWISNIIGTFFYWKNIPLVMIALSVYATFVVFFIPESPYYLASKSKFDECVANQRWLKGSNKISEKELRKLLCVYDSATKKPRFLKSLLNKRFYKATLLGMCLYATFDTTGKLACNMYALDIIKSMTSSEKTAYNGMIILDGFTVFSLCIGTIISKFSRRKLHLISAMSIGIISLFILSVIEYLVKISVLAKNEYLSLIFLSTYSIGIGCGPVSLCSTILGEILPLEFKSISVIFVGVTDNLISATIMKLTPLIAKKFGLHVVFFIFGALSSVFLFILNMFLPETKDKTLFEISDEIVGKGRNQRTEIEEHARTLMT